MPQLPLLSGREIVRIFEKLGYRVDRQRGSHIRLTCERRKPVTVPDYSEVDRSLLRKIIRDAELSPSEFLDLMKRR